MCHFVFVGHVVNVDISHVKANLHFCNKIWQAFRFFSKNIDKTFRPAEDLREVMRAFMHFARHEALKMFGFIHLLFCLHNYY